VPDVEKMHRFGVWFVYFAPWSETYGPTSMPTNTVERVYQSAEVLTLDESNAVLPRTVTVARTTGGPLLLAGKGPRGATCCILASTNLALPMTNWSPLATGKLAGGVFTFADTQATNLPFRFNRVARP
jgi:hypothetical protein